MKFQLENFAGLNAITAQSEQAIQVNRVDYAHSVIVAPKGNVQAWQVSQVTALTAQDLQPILDQQPEVVLLGTGTQQVFPSTAVLRAAAQAQVGVEVMSTAAAARTYNVLMSEGRKVIAALIVNS